MSTSSPAERLVAVPPPAFFALAFLAGEGLQRLRPLPSLGPSEAVRFAGIIVTATGLALAVGCPLLFLYRRTTLAPHRRPHTLLTAGPYRLSRNPMYVSLVLLYVGGDLLEHRLWPLLLLVVPLAVMDRVVIPFEEGVLRREFGTAFTDYCARVRRWV